MTLRTEDHLDTQIGHFMTVDPCDDIAALRQFYEDHKLVSSMNREGVTGMKRGGTYRHVGSIPADVYAAAHRLFPEMGHRELCRFLLLRYPQFRV